MDKQNPFSLSQTFTITIGLHLILHWPKKWMKKCLTRMLTLVAEVWDDEYISEKDAADIRTMRKQCPIFWIAWIQIIMKLLWNNPNSSIMRVL